MVLIRTTDIAEIRDRRDDRAAPDGSRISFRLSFGIGTLLRSRTPVAPHRGRLRSDLRSSSLDAAAFGGMVGFGETYLPAFVLAIGLSELTAGLIGSIPLLVGGTLQLASPALIRMLGSHKRWVVACSLVQSLMFIPLIIAAWWGSISAPAILIIASGYWAAGLATGPAWNTWIGTIVPPVIRSRYFAFRTRLSQVTVFAGFLLGGLTLQATSGGDRLLTVYAIMFAIAAVCRLVSTWMLYRQSEPEPIPPNMKSVSLLKLFGHLRHHRGGRLLVYLVAVQAATQTSGPYFTPYMFAQLNFSYAEFVSLIAVAFLAKVIALPAWGRLAHRIGAHRLLWIGGLAIVPLSSGWLVSESLAWLLVVQTAAGVAWAAYELAFFLLFFDSIEPEERTAMLTVHNWINSIGFVAGAFLGGVILHQLGSTISAYWVIFGVSSIGRALALLLLARVRPVERTSTTIEPEDISIRTLSVRPNAASLDTPVTASMNAQSLTESDTKEHRWEASVA